jgi:hypothetical protein
VDPVALAQAGPVAILLVGIGLLARAFIRGDFVPGHIYKSEQAQRIKAETLVDDLVKALAALAVRVTGNGGNAGPSDRHG